jgi:hypothetical protein
MKRRQLTVVAFALLPAVLLGFVSCSSPSRVEKTSTFNYREGVAGGTLIETYKLTATVVGVDAANRRVTLVASDGSQNTFTAGPGFTGFDQLRVGDAVHATVTRQLVVFLRKDGLPLSDGATAAKAPKGAQSAVLRADTVQRVAKVTAIDRKRRQATIELADGTSRTFAIRKDVDLQRAEPGEEVVIRTSSAVVLNPEQR